jgi:DNA-binding transcriptional LysR family regulator
MVNAVEEYRFRCFNFRMEKIVLFACPEHPLASNRKLETSKFERSNFAANGSRVCYRKMLEQILDLQRIRPRNITPTPFPDLRVKSQFELG